ncbi:MAG TPA: AraC family transcriptional regulator [Bryobacteraceae bacterium]|nr:AraC family transcriptional regulator [Bryobacteraceae bacterium]
MGEGNTFRNHVAEAFRAPDAPALIARTLRKSTVSITELRCEQPGFGITAQIPRDDAYLIALQFRACPDHDLYFDGRLIRPKNYRAGVTSIYDLRHHPVADIRDPYHSLMLHLPRKALHSLADEHGPALSGELRHEPGVSLDDPVVRGLLSSLLPALAKPEEAHPLFLDHVSMALMSHLAHSYGGMRRETAPPRGGLAPWQERRVKELMRESLHEEIPLSRLAEECGLSVRHFARAFRQSTGASPHRWLLKHRVEEAQKLLGKRIFTLSDIALSCGFADQSHFTRVFTAMVGTGPGAWRRANGYGR